MYNIYDSYYQYPLLRLKSKYFVAGIILRYPKQNILAPIVNFMKYWDINRIKKYCDKKEIKLEIL